MAGLFIAIVSGWILRAGCPALAPVHAALVVICRHKQTLHVSTFCRQLIFLISFSGHWR
jgi:hypothetical protein